VILSYLILLPAFISGCIGFPPAPGQPLEVQVAIIGSQGGSIQLLNGTIVTFEADVVSDNTQVVVSRFELPQTPLDNRIPVLSNTITIQIEAGKLLTTDTNPDHGITIEIPLRRSIELQAPLQSLQAPDSAYDIARLVIARGADLLELAARKLVQEGRAKIKLTKQLMQAILEQAAVTIEVTIINIRSFFAQGTHLYKIHPGPVLEEITTPLNVSKVPLVLIHGWQFAIDIGIDPQSVVLETWARFIEFFNQSDLRQHYELFAFRYDTDHHIFDMGLNILDDSGELLAQKMALLGQGPLVLLRIRWVV